MKIKATKPGQPPLRLEQRSTDSIVYTIDCSDIVDTTEIMFGSVEVTASNIKIIGPKAKAGNTIVFKAEGETTGTLPYIDHSVLFKVRTSTGSVRSIPISIRCYK